MYYRHADISSRDFRRACTGPGCLIVGRLLFFTDITVMYPVVPVAVDGRHCKF
jgi:hypothetical protein